MQVGDKVMVNKTLWDGQEVINETIYTVVEVDDEWLKLKHPEIGGHFIFKREDAIRVQKKK